MLHRSLLVLTLCALTPLASAADPRPRVLVIGVDAIGYDVIAPLTDPALGERAIFRDMGAPAAVLSSFPSDSYLAWTGLLRPLGVPSALGYETCYYSRAEQRMRGCFSLARVASPWQDWFDWRLLGLLRKGIAYGWPDSYALAEVDRGFAAFLASHKRVFSMYVVSTDGLGHVQGPQGQAHFMRALDQRLQALRARSARPFWTVIVSDHGVAGGEALKNTLPGVEAVLAKAGFRLAGAVGRSREIVLVKYGLLSSFVVHSAAVETLEIARLLVSVPGVDVCVAPQPTGWRVLSARGEALVGRRVLRPEPLWRYESLIGDPLGYAPVLQRLRVRAGEAQAQWFPESWWFEASKREFYPDALYRIADGFTLIENPAALVCSCSPGHMFGGLLTEYASLPTIGPLRWTHGALFGEANVGMLLTDVPGWPRADVVRYDQALAPLRQLMDPTVVAGQGRH